MNGRIMLVFLILLGLLVLPHVLMAMRIQGYALWSNARWDSAGIIDANPA